MGVDKLRRVFKENWWFCVDDKDEDWPDLTMFAKWVSTIAFVHEGFQLSRESEEKRTEEAQIETNGSRKHLISLLVRTRRKQNKCKVIIAR